GNRLLSRYAEGRGAAVDAGDLTGGPASARVIVIAMRVQKQQELFDAIKAQKHLSVAVGDETKNRTASRSRHADIGNNTDGGRSGGPHAINHQVRQVWRQHVGLKQLGVGTMRPLLRAWSFLGHGLAKGQLGSRQRSDVRRFHLLLNILFDAGDGRVLKELAAL